MNMVSIIKIFTITATLMFSGQIAAQSLSFGHHHHRQGVHATADNRITPLVPEPEIWAMTGVGLTMLIMFAQHRLGKK